MQEEVAQAGGTGVADAVLAAGALAVAQFEAGIAPEMLVATGDGHAVGVGEAELGAGVWTFLADDQAHPLRPTRQAVPASSATQAPSRISQSGSTAGVQADAATFNTACWVVSVMVMPPE